MKNAGRKSSPNCDRIFAMKFSIAISILILAIGGIMGSRHQKRLADLSAEQRSLAAKTEMPAAPAAVTKTAGGPDIKRHHGRRETRPADMVTDMLAFAREIDLQHESGEESEAFEKRAA